MMKIIHITTIIYLFSVVIPIQSGVYTYNYDNFSEIFQQGSGINDFHLYKYADIDTIFDEKYEGSNIGGAFLIEGNYSTNIDEAHKFEDYVVNITATYYCGSTQEEEGANSLYLYLQYADGADDGAFLCYYETGWNYEYTWTPKNRFNNQGFQVVVMASNVTVNRAYGFDELRITTTEKPPQLLQRDNNTASNDPVKDISSNEPRKNRWQPLK